MIDKGLYIKFYYLLGAIIIKVDIVGGSISGLSAAKSLKEHNKSIDVIVHEKYKQIGYNHEGRRCGEAHSIENEWKKWRPEKKSIFNEISAVESYLGNKKYVMKRKPGTTCILNRQEFICQLAREAEKFGVIIHTDDKIKSINDLDGDFIIDASGCPSIIKRELGIKLGLIGITYQQTLEESNWFFPSVMKIYYTDSMGYVWIFPRNPEKKEINLGLGFVGKYDGNLKKILEDFKKENNITGKVNYVTGGLIPGGLQRPLRYKNILFVGDTGVGAFPFSGQGIYRALISGDIAGRCIALNRAKRYPHIMDQKFIKWDIIGKTLYLLNITIGRINEQKILSASQRFMEWKGMLH